MLNSALSYLFDSRNTKSKSQANKARLQLECLEDRTMMDNALGAVAAELAVQANNQVARSLAQPNYHSNPGAVKKIYLDFNGHHVSGTKWNSNYNDGKTIHARPFSLDSDYNNFSSTELARIQEIWKRVAEDFRPFNVDVTTQDPGTAAFKAGNQAIRVLISTNYDDTSMGGTGKKWYNDAGGVAYVNSWGYKSDTPVWVFYNRLGSGSEKSVAEASSHEAGHALGLSHDGQGSTEYYKGHGSGNTGWAPIMGNSYSRAVSQWSKGEYSNATTTQDDIAIIAGKLGFRADDHGNNFSSATKLNISSSGNVNNNGIISTRNDVDYFYFTTTGGKLKLAINPFEHTDGKANLDIIARLYNSAGILVATSNPSGELYANFDLNLKADTYYLKIDGTGKSGAYSDYGSLGYYSISGNIQGAISARPGKTTLLTPSGTTHDTTPTFQWKSVATVTWYYLYIKNNDTGTVTTQWVKSATSYTPSSAMAYGNYTYWVNTWANGEYGGWSNPLNFKIEKLKPGKSTMLSPSGTTYDTTPTFTWTKASNATWYYLYIKNNGTGTVTTQWVKNATSYTPTTAMAKGSYTVWVNAWGNGEYSGWSQALNFKIDAVKPGKSTMLSPSGTTSDTTPTFTWTKASNATWYYLYIKNNGTGKVTTQWVKNATAFTPTTAMEYGSYTVWVNTWGNGEYSGWSQALNFKIEAVKPGKSSMLSPSGTTFDTTPTFTWTKASNATWYYLYIKHNDTGKVTTQWVKNATTYTPSKAMADGSYTVWVNTWGNGEYGGWSSPLNFKIWTFIVK